MPDAKDMLEVSWMMIRTYLIGWFLSLGGPRMRSIIDDFKLGH